MKTDNMENNKQLYQPGDKVRVVHIGWPMWEGDKIYDSRPEYIGHEGEIVGSYDDIYPDTGAIKIHKLNDDGSLGEEVEKKQNGPIGYEIKWPEGSKVGTVAWFHEYQLEYAHINTPRDQQRQYPSWKESPTGKEMDKIAQEMEHYVMWRTKPTGK